VDCHDARQQLHEFVDFELDECQRVALRSHLASCEECDDISRQLARLKQLLHAKVRRPSAPTGLVSLIRRRVAASRSPWRSRAFAAAAATLLACTSTAIVLTLIDFGGSRLAHADMVQHCVDEFVRLFDGSAGANPPGASPAVPVAEELALESIRRRTTVRLDSLPEIDGAVFRGSEPCFFNRIPGARLDYRLVDSNARIEYPICVFVFPLEVLESPRDELLALQNGKICRCSSREESTVYSFRSSTHVFNVVTTIDSHTLQDRYRPRLR